MKAYGVPGDKPPCFVGRSENSNSYPGQLISVEGIIGQRLGEYYNQSEHNRNLRFSKL